MSHFTTVQTIIREQVLLEEALRQLNYEFQSADELPIYGYQKNTETGQIVIKTGGPYDIGFQRQEDGSYVACADWWGVQRSCAINQEKFIHTLNRTYAHLAVKRQVMEQGLIIEEERILENGDIELTVCDRF